MRLYHFHSSSRGLKKKLEIKYTIPPDSPVGGLREIDAQDWSYLLNSFGCQILNSIKNEFFDAYLLSESSLFVYRDKVVLKTCGTTRLLSCLSLLDQYARNAFECESLVEYALFTRRNYKFPEKQPAPHTCWDEEKLLLKQNFKNGKEFVVGDITSDHFFVFMEDNRPKDANVEQYSTIEVAMHELHGGAMAHFFKNDKFESESITLVNSGITGIIPESTNVDALMFNPFGFSLNGLLEDAYYTMHITPQPECSYVSYETNRDMNDFDIEPLMRKVVDNFQPERYTFVMIHSKHYNKITPSDMFSVKNLEISPHFDLNFYSFVNTEYEVV